MPRITIAARRVVWPDRCCCCGERGPRGFVAVGVWDVPCCPACVNHQQAARLSAQAADLEPETAPEGVPVLFWLAVTFSVWAVLTALTAAGGMVAVSAYGVDLWVAAMPAACMGVMLLVILLTLGLAWLIAGSHQKIAKRLADAEGREADEAASRWPVGVGCVAADVPIRLVRSQGGVHTFDVDRRDYADALADANGGPVRA